ncbi:MAG: MHYT domain-containing protein [Alphaproteobacteria bacterium]
MFRIVACVHEHHNLWLVLLAAGICIAASGGAFFVLGGLAAGQQSRRWRFLAGLLAGGGAWAMHFVAMLGYDPGLPIDFDLELTLLSSMISIAGAWAALRSWRAGAAHPASTARALSSPRVNCRHALSGWPAWTLRRCASGRWIW